jgi:hypothetical protein
MTAKKTNKKKKTTKPAVSTATTETEGLPPGYPPPTVDAPPVPAGWKKAKWPSGQAGLRPKKAQVANFAGTAAELQKSTTWVEDFGNKAPDPDVIASSLVTASGWRDSWVKAVAWLAYCTDQRRLWEDDALEKLATLKPAFDYASANDASIVKTYPAMTQLLEAPNAIAQRGATVRMRDKAAAKAATPTPAASTPPVTEH